MREHIDEEWPFEPFDWDIRTIGGTAWAKQSFGEEAFSKIIEQYNSGGKTAAYGYLRSEYGIKHPYFVINRIKECGKYLYDADTDHSPELTTSVADGVLWILMSYAEQPQLPQPVNPIRLQTPGLRRWKNWFTS